LRLRRRGKEVMVSNFLLPRLDLFSLLLEARRKSCKALEYYLKQ
jgi:hypothetical protein